VEKNTIFRKKMYRLLILILFVICYTFQKEIGTGLDEVRSAGFNNINTILAKIRRDYHTHLDEIKNEQDNFYKVIEERGQTEWERRYQIYMNKRPPPPPSRNPAKFPAKFPENNPTRQSAKGTARDNKIKPAKGTKTPNIQILDEAFKVYFRDIKPAKCADGWIGEACEFREDDLPSECKDAYFREHRWGSEECQALISKLRDSYDNWGKNQDIQTLNEMFIEGGEIINT
jgi:hypothetical protein